MKRIKAKVEMLNYNIQEKVAKYPNIIIRRLEDFVIGDDEYVLDALKKLSLQVGDKTIIKKYKYQKTNNFWVQVMLN